MDALLAIASKRDLRDYDGRALSERETRLILDAGRLAGSARNRQPWRFVVVTDPEVRERLAAAVYVPENVRTAGLVVAIVASGQAGFDCGRAAQNMMLAAWSEGIGSCPNGSADPDLAHELIGVEEGETLQIVLSFGHPTRTRDPGARSVEEWSQRAKRRPLDDVVTVL